MNRKEILEEITKTEKHLATIKKMLEDCDYERWKPEDNEMFWYIDSSGFVNYSLFMPETESRFKNYNCFQTREQAEAEAEKILVRRQLEDIAKRLNKGEKIDWRDDNQPKFYLYYNYCSKNIKYGSENIKYGIYYHGKIAGVVYCLTEKFLDVAIKEIGKERLLKYLKGC